MPKAIGIDLGTTTTCVAVLSDKQGVEVIYNRQGNRVTPSYVAFTPDGHLVGDDAKSMEHVDSENTIFDCKRLIGKNFNDADVQSDMKYWPFRVIPDEQNPSLPTIEVNYMDKKIHVYPEHVSAFILEEAKLFSEQFVGEEVTSAVITVPANFANHQREATFIAAKIAGFKNVTFINEPTAAAIAYGFTKMELGEPKIIVVYDIGGGTFDVSVLRVDKNMFEVLSTGGNPHLGGEDFDNCILEYVLTKLPSDHELSKNCLHQLKLACKKAKHSLVNSKEARIIENFSNIQIKETITQSKFNMLCDSYFQSTIDIVDATLRRAHKEPSDIHKVIMIGGSSRIPKLQQLVATFFEKPVDVSINPEEAVAIGAATEAAKLHGDPNVNAALKNYLLLDILPMDLGVCVGENEMSALLRRGSTIPIETNQYYQTSKDGQTSVRIKIYEGQDENVEKNFYLGEFKVEGIASMEKNKTKVNILFNVNESGLLSVNATEEVSGVSNDIVVTKTNKRLSSEAVDNMMHMSKKMRGHIQVQQLISAARNELEDLCYSVKNAIMKQEENVKLQSACSTLSSECSAILSWLRDKKITDIDSVTSKQATLKSSYSEFLEKAAAENE